MPGKLTAAYIVSGFFYNRFMKTLLFILCLSALSVACEQSRHETAAPLPGTPAQATDAGSSILQLDQRLLTADSLVFVFYKDPLGSDSLRYTRFYTQFSTNDIRQINFVLENLEGKTAGREKVKPCRSEGKIWCYTKGKVFQTIYFADYNSPCSFVYMIKDGRFYYGEISSALSKRLKSIKGEAKEI